MYAIKPANKEFPWIVSPYREVADTNSIRVWLDARVKAHNVKYACVVGNEVSFSLYEGMDFGRTLAATCKHPNYIYIESRDEGIVFIHINEGKVLQDSILDDLDALTDALDFALTILGTLNSSAYRIEYFGISEALDKEAINNLILEIVPNNKSLRELPSSLFDSIELSDLSDNQVFYFVEFKNAVRDLADTKTQKMTVIGIVIFVLIYWAFSADIFDISEKKERLELVDDYKEYTQKILSGNSFSARLAQDFKIHKLLNRELPNWKLYKVTHTENTIEYRVIHQSHIASIRGLTLFADNYGMAILNDSNGLGLVASVDKQPIYKHESEVRLFILEELTANIIDIESSITPFATVGVKRTDAYGHWSSRELSVLLSGASNHDLLRIAAIIDGYPERYPAVFASCQSQGCSYDVSPQGILKGAINFTIYGYSFGDKSNGQ